MVFINWIYLYNHHSDQKQNIINTLKSPSLCHLLVTTRLIIILISNNVLYSLWKLYIMWNILIFYWCSFIPLTWYWWNSCICLHIVMEYSFLFYGSLLYEYIMIYLSILLLVGIWAISSLGLLQIMMPWMFILVKILYIYINQINA